MVKQENTIDRVFSKYSKLPLGEKIHIYVRYKTCPWAGILKNMPAGDSLIDIGCGHGLFINLLDLTGNNFKSLIGTDPDAGKINIARQTQDKGIRFYTESIFSLEQSCDVYSAMDVLYLLPYEFQHKIIQYVYDKLPLGGYFVIKDVVKRPLWKYWVLFIQDSLMVKVFKRTYGKNFYFTSGDAMKNRLLEAGFRNIDVKRIDKGYAYPHILYVCRK